MKKNVKYLLSMLICFAFIILGSKVYAISIVADKEEIKIGETITIQLDKKKTTKEIYTYEYTPTEWSTSSKGIIEITSNKDTAKIKGINKGTATIKVKCKLEVYTGTGEEVMGPRGPVINKNIISTATTTIKKKITVLNESKEAEELANKVDEGNQTINDMMNAYKTIPNANASATEIDRFIKSDAAYNNLNNLKTVSKEVAKKWKDTVSAARIDAISRKMYTKTVDVLDSYINGKDIDIYKDGLSSQIEEAIDATQTTVDNYKKQILKIQSDLGIARPNVEFTDVLTNLNTYIPTDEASDGRLEKKASVILTTITNIGMILAVLMIAIIGVKYMLGSVEEKAEYKKDMIPYLVGACLLFGITVIVKVLQQIGQSINNI